MNNWNPHDRSDSERPRGPQFPRSSHPGTNNYPADHNNPSNNTYSANNQPHRSHNPHTQRTNEWHQEQARNPRLDPLPPGRTPSGNPSPQSQRENGATHQLRTEKKVTVTRVAAARVKELTGRGYDTIYRAATADGADRSGLTALTLPVVLSFAVDAAMTVALANTFFFAAASGESKTKVALYLLVNIAPFAVIAPLIGPLLDRLQRGRRIAMAATFLGRALLGILVISNSNWNSAEKIIDFDPYVLYPAALAMMVLSKSFGVLKSSVVPRVLPPTIDLVQVNSRLSTFGLLGGSIVGGAIAGIFEFFLGKLLPWHFPGAMIWLVLISFTAAALCMRIPSWVESTKGEVPTTLTYHGEPEFKKKTSDERPSFGKFGAEISKTMRQPLGRNVLIGLWGNGTIRILTGFLTLFIAFHAKAQPDSSGFEQLLMVGAVGAAAGIGNFSGNFAGTRFRLTNPQQITVLVAGACVAAAVAAALFNSIIFAIIAGFVGSCSSAIGKVCLDSSIQTDLPDASRASAFGRSETVLQLTWVLGASVGVLVQPQELVIGFGITGALMLIALIQTIATTRGTTLVPGFGGRRPQISHPTTFIHKER